MGSQLLAKSLGGDPRFQIGLVVRSSTAPLGSGRWAPTEQSTLIETYLKAAEDDSVAAQFIIGLAHPERYFVENNGLSAYYWLRLAEENSCEFGHQRRALVE